ncbi:MAG TPA: OmpA family protein [Candidatus Eisenbacteria bacterium]|nr:OmpA family protein [Candidatus Eisenbacteria bacterium]
MRTFARVVFALSLVLLPSMARAGGEDLPGWWLAPGGGVAWFPNELATKETAPTFGGILGFRLSPTWALEARGHFATADSAVGTGSTDFLHGEGNLTWFLSKGAFKPYVTAGAGAISIDNGSSSESKFAWNGGAGFHVGLSGSVALRLDGRVTSYKVLVPSSNKEEYKYQPEIFGGLLFGFGGKPSDDDADGVPNKLDKCPATPLGARVDANGCPVDGDGDGVPDGLDQCDGTPKGATVDVKGCPSDSDGDGVFDGLDTCADTPKGAKVDASGCPMDSDKDGVFDGLDQCEGTPFGCTVSPNGCQSDADQDGVCDGIDKCPDTPANVRVDKLGCPIEVSQKETELLDTGMIRLQDVNFDTGKSIIKPESYKALDEVGNILARWPELRVEIGGHTDARGSDAQNQKLSDSRAKAVLDYLLNKFPELKTEQFTSKGYGETQPIASNTTQLGMAKNRRVEFKVLNTDVLKREKEKRSFAPKQ